jgi:hypothetical protein
MRYRLERGSHSVYALYYHYVQVVKYRRKVFDSKLPRPHGRGFGVSSGLHDTPSFPLQGVYAPPTRVSR